MPFYKGYEEVNQWFVAIQPLFEEQLAAAPEDPIVNLISYTEQTAEPVLHYFFSDNISGRMKRFTGEKTGFGEQIRKITITDEEWYASQEISLNTFLSPMAERLLVKRSEAIAQAYPRHKLEIISSLLESGFTANGYDGVPFFSDSHPISTGTQSNLMTASPLTADNLDAAILKLSRMKDYNGHLIGARATHLIVPPELERTARLILNPEIINATTNIDRGRVQLVVSQYLTSPSNWYVFDASRTLHKPIIFHVSDMPTLQMDDTYAVSKKLIVWSADARYQAALGLYQFIVGCQA